MSLNKELIQKRVGEIEDSLKRLEKLKESAKDEFLKDNDLQDIASYRLLVAVEAALNLCYHVAAKKLGKVPEEYAECFGILSDAGIIPQELSEKLKKMARFRNMLVHRYWKIDYGLVYDILQDSLEHIRTFSKAMSALV